jgi:hypothetical protein
MKPIPRSVQRGMNVKQAVVVPDIVCLSDLHCGDRFGLYPLDVPLLLDEGSAHQPGHSQRLLWEHFVAFREWVWKMTEGRPYILVTNGDCIDGVHHDSVTQFTNNKTDQKTVAKAVLQSLRDRAMSYYAVRGTEVHAGKSGQDEEGLAELLGATRAKNGHYARWNLWLKVGGVLCNFKHHIGTTGSAAFAATALSKEVVLTLAEAARLNKPIPRVIVRSHRHVGDIYIKPSPNGDIVCVVTPGWQIVSPFAWRIPGSRQNLGEFGGIIIRIEDGEPHIKTWTRAVDRDETEVVV